MHESSAQMCIRDSICIDGTGFGSGLLCAREDFRLCTLMLIEEIVESLCVQTPIIIDVYKRQVQAFQPPYLGGEQERQMRPGTENLPYAMGLAAAATRLAKTMKSRDTAMRALNRQLREGLKAFPEVVINLSLIHIFLRL